MGEAALSESLWREGEQDASDEKLAIINKGRVFLIFNSSIPAARNKARRSGPRNNESLHSTLGRSARILPQHSYSYIC